MDCPEFREQHVAYVDDVLSAEDMARMEGHLEKCPACAHHDTAVRRGLLVARNLPRVHCSADFMERLNARLEEGSSFASELPARRPWRSRQGGIFAAFAASAMAAAALVAWAVMPGGPPQVLRLHPVVASQPAADPSPISAPSYMMAPLAVGLPVWSVVLAADETPMHLATMEMREER